MGNIIIKAKKIFIPCLLFVVFIILVISFFENYFILKIPTESMLPTIKPVSYVIVQKDSDYSVGDIIAYKNVKDSKIITHRIIDINNETVITKGDNNSSPDVPFHKNLIMGEIIKIYSTKQIILYSCVFSFLLFIATYLFQIFTKRNAGLNERNKEKDI